MNKKVWGILGMLFGVIGFFFATLIIAPISMIIGAFTWEENTGKASFWIGLIDVVLLFLFLLLL